MGYYIVSNDNYFWSYTSLNTRDGGNWREAPYKFPVNPIIRQRNTTNDDLKGDMTSHGWRMFHDSHLPRVMAEHAITKKNFVDIVDKLGINFAVIGEFK